MTTTPTQHLPGEQRGYRFEHSPGLEYLLFLPQSYGGHSKKKWPLILYLHGMGECGDDLELVKVHGIAKKVEHEPDFPFITISPQCPLQPLWWHNHHEALNGILDKVVATHAADSGRIYLTGNSMGGFGTWSMAAAYPERFAALAPICGGGDPDTVCSLTDVPVWAFHGARDEAVLPELGQKIVDALRDCGGDVKFTVYADVGHDSWTQTYDNPELYEWFLQYARAKGE